MTGNAVLSLPLNANLLSSRDTAAEHGVKKQYRRLTRTWASAVLTEVLLQLRGVQAVRNLRNVRETHGARWIDVPGFAKDLYTTCDRPTRVCGRHRIARRQSVLGRRGTLPPGLAPVMRLLRIENNSSRSCLSPNARTANLPVFDWSPILMYRTLQQVPEKLS